MNRNVVLLTLISVFAALLLGTGPLVNHLTAPKPMVICELSGPDGSCYTVSPEQQKESKEKAANQTSAPGVIRFSPREDGQTEVCHIIPSENKKKCEIYDGVNIPMIDE